MVTASEELEIAGLASRFGAPLRETREYGAAGPRNAVWLRRLLRRRGEVILAVPDPGGAFILHTKVTYPDGIYRLPGGGIDAGELAEDAARRELGEETGFDLPITRFLGVVDNDFDIPGQRLSYPSYVFLFAPTTLAPRVMDANEPISGFKLATPEELARVVADLDSLPPDWQPWGRFRSAPHALLLRALSGSSLV